MTRLKNTFNRALASIRRTLNDIALIIAAAFILDGDMGFG